MLTQKIEFGDFQTPPALAAGVCDLLRRRGIQAASLVEPTCGVGSFLKAGATRLDGLSVVRGYDVNPMHVRRAAESLAGLRPATEVICADFFGQDWARVATELPAPVLFLGNPPWVTVSQLGTGGATNLPAKTNFKGHRGLDALTGKANFDICEWMLLRLLDALDGREGAVAMLCKASVARKALLWAWGNGHQMRRCSLHGIDAKRHFGASVDAVLLLAEYAPDGAAREAACFDDLDGDPSSTLACVDGRLVADAAAYRRSAHLHGRGPRWRSGVKHDAARVMELSRVGGLLKNGFGETVDVEADYLFPMLKSSDVAGGRAAGNRFMLVPQRRVGQETAPLAETAPWTWAYLTRHAGRLDARRSKIYRGKPQFSVFGVGDYTFCPWKVAVSGFYRGLNFRVVGPHESKPVVFDDTVYFLPFARAADARRAADALASPEAADYFTSLTFPDAKRFVTADLLCNLDLRRLGVGGLDASTPTPPTKAKPGPEEATLWPSPATLS